MELCTLSTGDKVYRYYKSIVIVFQQPRKVLSTSPLNGGYHEDLTAVFNHDCNPGAGMACRLRAPTYEEHMKLVAEDLGLGPETVTGIATAASMNNVSVQTETYQNLTVTALVTGGIEVNGGRAGDPASCFKPIDKLSLAKPGTINILLAIDADLPPGTLARALVTCTEAKTAALQELLAGSNYSNGLATGSGTDSAVLIANPQAPFYLENAGKHSKLGELIGVTVKRAVKEALAKQTGLSPAYQHSMLRRFKRFGVTEEALWQEFAGPGSEVSKAVFLAKLHAMDGEAELVTNASLYIHLVDQLLWGLLEAREAATAGNRLLTYLAGQYQAVLPEIGGSGVVDFLKAWKQLIAGSIRQRVREPLI